MKQILSPSTLLTAASLVAIATGDEYTHQYKKGDRVDLWVNKVRHFLCGRVVGFLKLKKNDKRYGETKSLGYLCTDDIVAAAAITFIILSFNICSP